MRSKHFLVAAAAVPLLGGSLLAQSLVKDINTAPAPNPSAFDTDLHTGGASLQSSVSIPYGVINAVYFVAENAAQGSELFVHPVHPATTALPIQVCDTFPGPSGAVPRGLYEHTDGKLYFWATDGSHGRELRYIDPNTALTSVNLVADLNPGSASSSIGPNNSAEPDVYSMVSLNGDLYFVCDGPGVAGLYKWDGTSVTQVKACTPLPVERTRNGFQDWVRPRLVATNGLLFFCADDASGSGQELWVSDGTPIGTTMVQIRAGLEGSDARDFAVFGNQVLFAADDGVNGFEPWITDGTPVGTMMLGDLESGGSSDPRAFFVTDFGGTQPLQALFLATDDTGGAGTELFKTDGTPAGTSMVADLYPGSNWRGPYDSNPVWFHELAGWVYFVASSATSKSELYLTDGTTANTALAPSASVNPGPDNVSAVTSMGGKLYFFADSPADGRELHSYDPSTPASTSMGDHGTAFSIGYDAQNMIPTGGGTLFYAYDDGSRGFEPYMSDGTPAGTKPISTVNGDLNPVDPAATASSTLNAAGYGARRFVTVGTTAYFWANDGSGPQIFQTDGSDAGTSAITPVHQDFISGAAPSVLETPLYAYQEKLYTAFNDGSGNRPWVYDFTSGSFAAIPGPAFASYKPMEFAGLNGKVYINANQELTRYNPVTGAVTDFAVGGSVGSLFPHNGKLFFVADDGSGLQPYVSDGTIAGTVKLPVNLAGSGVRSDASFAAIGDQVLFFGDDGSTGLEPWISDGTAAGTSLLKDIALNAASSVNTSSMHPTTLSTASGDRVLFFADDALGMGAELWITDGSSANTLRLLDINPGSPDSYSRFTYWNQSAVAAGDKVFFVADDGQHGEELWVTDGTAGSTMMVKDINPGSSASGIAGLTAIGARYAYFSAYDPIRGQETWRSDGTAAGTVIVADIAPGNRSGIDTLNWGGGLEYGYVNGKILISANDGTVGNEVWSVTLPRASSIAIGSSQSSVAKANFGTSPDLGGRVVSGVAPTLTCSADPVIGTTISLDVASAEPNATLAALIYGFPTQPTTFSGALPFPIYVDLFAPTGTLWLTIDANGESSTPLMINAWPSLIGVELSLQAGTVQANGVRWAGFDVAITNGLTLRAGL